MQGFLNSVNSVVWGAPMLLLFIFTAVRFTLSGKFFQIRGIKKILKSTLGTVFKRTPDEGVSQFGAFCSVLGACIGTGNIVGVATAIYAGGPGTVFWMWISAVFSMMTAYAENYLGIVYTKKASSGRISGGAFAYIEKGVGIKGLAEAYAVFCFFSAMGMGNLTQSNSVASSLSVGFGINEYITGTVVAVLTLIIISGGIRRIAAFGTVAVPLMSIGYLVLSVAVLWKFKENLLPAVALIFKEAFSFKAFNGYGIYKAARYGISRGVFSNEAGLGSSTIMHSQVENADGKTQGMWAMVEVFIDTVFLCTVTAAVILVSTNTTDTKLFGAELSSVAYGSIGEIGKKGIALMTAVFAFTSLASCSFYGEKSFGYLFSDKYPKLYKALYIVLSFIGSVNSPKIIWTFADICNGLMAVPNLFALNCLAKEVSFPKVRNEGGGVRSEE